MLRKFLSLILVCSFVAIPWGTVSAQTSDNQYFSETGHNVSGEFLTFYTSNPNALFLYGYPITEQIISKDGKTVQYFQRTRFEFVPENVAGQRVKLTPLGRELYETNGNSFNFQNFFSCRNFDETGFSVCFDFLEFFDTYGGLAQFGFPISGFEYREDRLIQYFENARIEWQPWKFEGQRVAISDLGRAYFDTLGEDPALLAPASPINNAPKVITALQVRAFALKAVTLANDNQTFYIIVQDQNGTPVPNVNCVTVVQWTKDVNDTNMMTTNMLGIGIFSLQFSNQPQGNLVNVNVTCTYDVLSATTTTSFRIWY